MDATKTTAPVVTDEELARAEAEALRGFDALRAYQRAEGKDDPELREAAQLGQQAIDACARLRLKAVAALKARLRP